MNKTHSLVDGPTLSKLLAQLSKAMRVSPASPFRLSEEKPLPELSVETNALDTLLCNLNGHVDAARREGELLNVWTIAGIGRNEIRNVSVLAWLFNRNGSHGQGSAFLRAFLSTLKDQLPQSFQEISDQYSVSVETYPLANKETRVDIEIEAENFLIFVEAKIDALEGNFQVPRLKTLVEEKASALRRTPLVIFLCVAREGTASHSDKRVIATWDNVADSIETCLGQGMDCGVYLDRVFRQFAEHMRQF
jgi:hypothetical protein